MKEVCDVAMCSSVVCEAVQRRLLRVYLKSCACEHARA
jgi:hypothetical protein